MKAGVVHAKEDLRYEDIEKPVPKEGEVLVKVKYTGICGSDIPRVNWDACHFFPNILGHEFSGVVEETGAGVTRVKPGDRVAGVPLVPCMKCADCQKGDYSLCRHYSFIGSRQFGSFAQYVVVPELNAVKFAEEVSFEQAALFEPATVALHGLERTGYKGGHTVAILGTGPIGMLPMQWAKIFGASKVVVFDFVDEKLELAKELGADIVIDSREKDAVEEIMKISEGRGVDKVFDTSGAPICIQQTAYIARRGGTVILVGISTKSEISYSFAQIMDKELTIKSVFRYRNIFPKAIAAVAKGAIDVKQIVTHEIDFDHINDAYQECVTNKTDLVKAVIKVR